MQVSEIMVSTIAAVPRDATIIEAAQMMREFHVGDVFVVDQRGGKMFPVGIVTDRDIIVEAVAPGVAVNSLVAEDIMSSELVTASRDMSLYEAARLMEQEGIRRLPVLGSDGSLEGVVSADDVLDILANSLKSLSRVSRSQRSFEEQSRK